MRHARFIVLVLHQNIEPPILPLAYVPDNNDAKMALDHYEVTDSFALDTGAFEATIPTSSRPGHLWWLSFSLVYNEADCDDLTWRVEEICWDKLEEKHLRTDWRPV